MTERHASRTAVLVAAYRARATKRESALISDPWAEGFAGPEGDALAAKVDALLGERELWVALRTAHLDAHVVHWTTQGGRQVVVLGAGFDSRAARLARPGIRFFEVDQPASQAEKRARIQAQPSYPAGAATYVACDFAKDDFLDRLVASGFDVAAPALILWEGVTYYLPEVAIRTTLERIAKACHPESLLLFDYFTRDFVEGASRGHQDEATRAFVESLGERFVFGTNDPVPMMSEAGFRHVRTISFDEICLSLTGTYERNRQFRFQRILSASVSHAPPP